MEKLLENFELLKNRCISSLLDCNAEELLKVYLRVGEKSYSRLQLSDEINNNSDIGLKTINNMITLSLDLFIRNKI